MNYRSFIKPKFLFPLPISDRQSHMMPQTVYRPPFTVHRLSHIMTNKVPTHDYASGCRLPAYRLLTFYIVILNLFQDPISIENDTARIFPFKCVAAGIPDQVRNDGE